MNIVTSTHSKAEYIEALKENMSGHFELGTERFTGFFIKNWFHVTHHAGYEWNRRYSNQKNAAVGYVKETENGCEVRFVCFKGALVPSQFLLMLALTIPLILIMAFLEGITDENIIRSLMWFCLISIIPAALITTFFESVTERSEEGKRILLALLIDPKDPFSYLNNRNQIP